MNYLRNLFFYKYFLCLGVKVGGIIKIKKLSVKVKFKVALQGALSDFNPFKGLFFSEYLCNFVECLCLDF